MSNKKNIKLEAKEAYYKDLSEKKSRNAALKAMSADERKAAKQADREAAKKAKQARKAEIKSMVNPEKKQAKLFDRYYKKYRTRTKRYATWSVIGVLLFTIILQYGSVVGDIAALLSLEVNSGTAASEEALRHGEALAEAISDEGIVLLKNKDNTLPLTDRKVNVFGLSATNFRTAGGGSGASDQSRAVSFYEGLSHAGIAYNQELFEIYSEMGKDKGQTTGLGQVLGAFMSLNKEVEPEISYLTDGIITNAQSYSNNAIIVLSSSSVEASDATPEQLKLSKNQDDLIRLVAENFENVIVIINAGNARELGFLDEYETIKAALWVGLPGAKGANSIGRVLTGEVNPSGRLVDTYVYNIESHPSMVNFGDFDYTNIKGMSLLQYEESIYIGYRFFETYYKDDEEGYRKAVQYPFGYGLSYTDFEWKVVKQEMNKDTIRLEVSVSNTGNVAGKDVVQIYFSAPYTEGGIEKSAIELAAYGKTSLLEPGQSEILTLEYDVRDMSSYDMHNEEAYVLDAGTYNIYVSRNVHDPVEVIQYIVDERIVYATDEVTGTGYSNLFDYANGGLTYLSRADWEGTYPSLSDLSYEALDEVIKAYTSKPQPASGTAPTTGADNGIKLEELYGLDYEDPKWDLFLDQFTVEEMSKLVSNGAYRTVAIDRLGVPETTLLDGPAGISFFFKSFTAASYPTESVIASTWNNDLAYAWGEAVGKEAKALGVHGWYAPALNVHRSPLGGRNFEYFAEDPLLSGMIGASAVQGAQSQDILVFIKHFALNEQEVNARTGVMVWADEQAIREIHLRPFEIAVKQGNAHGVMSSFILIGPKWSGGNPELLQQVLRKEWGFDGLVSTDAVIGGFMEVNLAIRNGNELMLAVLPSMQVKALKNLYKDDPVGITQALRDRTHTICYTILNYTDAIVK